LTISYLPSAALPIPAPLNRVFSPDLVQPPLEPLTALQTCYRNRSDFIRRAQHADAPTQSDETCFHSIVGVEHCSTLFQLQVPHVASRSFRTTALSCFASPALQTCSRVVGFIFTAECLLLFILLFQRA